jgi:tetratricopeptide (TPR) repeat protein
VNGQTPAPGFDLSSYGVRIDPDKRLIVVLAALEAARTKNAAGEEQKLINTPLSDAGLKFREQILRDTADMPDDLRVKLGAFVTQYRKLHPKLTEAEVVAPFISMAYTLSPPPELSDPVITMDLPGNLLDVLDFAPLAREFYRRSGISSKLDAYATDARKQADTGILRTSTRDMVSEMLDYLHTRPQLIFTERIKTETQKGKSKSEKLERIEIKEHERHFYVVPENLAPAGSVNFVNIRDDYYLIVPADVDLSRSEARRAFLQYVFDPLVLSNSKEVGPVRTWAKPVLDDLIKTNPNISPDIYLTLSRSLVAATDVREGAYVQVKLATEGARNKILRMRTDDEKRVVSKELEKFKSAIEDEAALRLYEDYQKGAILSFYFADQLKGMEESGFDIASSLREMIASFDPVKEATRITSTAEERSRALVAREERKKNPTNANAGVVENPVVTRLIEIQKAIDGRQLSEANTALKQLAAEYPSEPRIYYNMGRVASLMAEGIADSDLQNRKLIEAKEAYSKVLKTGTNDRALLSLTYVALARIYEFYDNNNDAIHLYQEAIKLGEVTGGAYAAALDATKRLSKPQ